MTQISSLRVDIISDVVCPWCVIGYHQLARAAQETGIDIDVHWHPFELNPYMAEEGENLREHLAAKYGTTLEGSIKARARLTELGANLGFTFNYADDMRIVNTFRAHQLIDIAEAEGKAHDTKMALYSAFFSRRENLNDVEVLLNVAQEMDLDQDVVRVALETGVHAQSVREKQLHWASQGISSVPALVFDREHLVTGAQGEENCARILTHLVDQVG